LALGGGLRRNGFAYSVVSNGVTTQDYNVARSSRYAFGELNLPVVAPANAVPGVQRLNLSAALRYEDYPGMARMTTPRLGLIYVPVRDITIKASWGRSFKAPTLYQQFMGYQTYLLPGSWYGLPSGNLLLASGGDTRLTPERARTWQAGVTVEPAALSGLRVEASYFDVQYRDRVAEPFPGSIASALSNPGNAGLVTYAPSATALTTLVAGSRPALVNYTGAAFDPAGVAVLVDDRYSTSHARPSAASTCAQPGKSPWTISAHWPSTSPGPGSTATRSCRPGSRRPALPA
jgi:outer membrane receptor protein involved in Fe transport